MTLIYVDMNRAISDFLAENGVTYGIETKNSHSVIFADTRLGRQIAVIPVPAVSSNAEESAREAKMLSASIEELVRKTGERPLLIPEDRWRKQGSMMKARLLAHIGIFVQIYARNCEVRKIDKKTAARFLEDNHSYSDASCRHRYGLYLKRHTGHNVSDRRYLGELVAVATFSNARKWLKGEKTIRSYEWTRYASLPGMRINGGMGKMLKKFIEDVRPDDVMTYADLEWSEGKVYEALGFMLEGRKDPVTFAVDTNGWNRYAIKSDGQWFPSDFKFYTNFGSNKYRLKLTDYQ